MIENFYLSPHFSFYEFTRSLKHPGLNEENRWAAIEKKPKLEELAAKLEVIRNRWELPLIIHSGFRFPQLNSLVGGADTSQHPKAEAADFHIKGVNLLKVFHWIWHCSSIIWGQLIYECVSSREGSPDLHWIHMSLGTPWREAHRCRQVLMRRDDEWTRLDK